MFSQSTVNHIAVLLCVICASLAVLLTQCGATPTPVYLSRWAAPQSPPEALPAPIVAEAQPAPLAVANVPDVDAVVDAGAVGKEPLEQYNQGSVLHESVADGRVRLYQRNVATGGSLAYIVAMLDNSVHIEVVNADGATPGSDATGDTIWTDGGQHLATVEEMFHAPYAVREGMDLLGAMAFGFHGAVPTSNEGTVVINGTIHRVNPWRSALCITHDRRAQIGLFDEAELQACAQAIGAGPVILWNGKIANPDVSTETDEFVPFNPLGENFVQLDWRTMIYTGLYPKTAICVGNRADGVAYLALAVSYDMNGIDLARQLRDMGCRNALGGDDDTSTQMIWRGAPIQPRQVREVPDAVGVYVRR
jgi:hypothetical protein